MDCVARRGRPCPGWLARSCLAALGCLLALLPDLTAASAAGAAAADLATQRQVLAGELAHSPFGAPLVLHSTESAHDASGDVWALVEHPFTRLAPLTRADSWCAVLILHINTKYCRPRAAPGDAGATPEQALDLRVGRKSWQELDDASRLELRLAVRASAPDYLRVALRGDQGPMGTSDYQIDFEAIPAGPGRSFVHLRYAYGFGTVARLAMQAYLGTLGRGKVGFSLDEAGEPVAGVRGVLERNAMRYYLAIDAWLSAPGRDPGARLAYWFDATQRYAQQLAEMDRETYLDMKHREIARQGER